VAINANVDPWIACSSQRMIQNDERQLVATRRPEVTRGDQILSLFVLL